ncbi:hypothetical protein Y032_0020g186 [Ancylostoma ceylanicum]|uniref:Uncharacterized protein n=1 Tax=Ancylostoma ceylanicum TaxID=53326 RepID=A0A016V0R8_9BILA|nr:hypothetical protein Y032_0020g186 [Ancylostoma ceylanicum]
MSTSFWKHNLSARKRKTSCRQRFVKNNLSASFCRTSCFAILSKSNSTKTIGSDRSRGQRLCKIHLREAKTSLVAKTENSFVGKLGKSCNTHETHILSYILFVLFVTGLFSQRPIFLCVWLPLVSVASCSFVFRDFCLTLWELCVVIVVIGDNHAIIVYLYLRNIKNAISICTCPHFIGKVKKCENTLSTSFWTDKLSARKCKTKLSTSFSTDILPARKCETKLSISFWTDNLSTRNCGNKLSTSF